MLKKVSVDRINRTNKSYDASIKDRIAIVFAKGTLLYGECSESIIAQGVFVETIEEKSNQLKLQYCSIGLDSLDPQGVIAKIEYLTYGGLD